MVYYNLGFIFTALAISYYCTVLIKVIAAQRSLCLQKYTKYVRSDVMDVYNGLI